MDRIPVAAPDLNGNEQRYVADAIQSSWISSTGPYVDRFEHEFASFAGTRTAIAVANGTVALHLALLALDAGAGDEVIVPSLTYIASANAVKYVGAEPVFVDVDPTTWCMDPAQVEAAVTPRTKGLIAVHLYGHPADMDALNASLATLATFSFYGNKIMTSGEGGALTLDDPDLERRIRLLRGQGMDPRRRYFFPVVGYNYRLTNVACALLCAQLERVDAFIERRAMIAEAYVERLGSIPGIELQPRAPWATPANWLVSVAIAEDTFGISRDLLAQRLAESGIESRPFFYPIHRLPPYEASWASERSLPVTDSLAARGLNLPTFTKMSDADIARVAGAIKSART